MKMSDQRQRDFAPGSNDSLLAVITILLLKGATEGIFLPLHVILLKRTLFFTHLFHTKLETSIPGRVILRH